MLVSLFSILNLFNSCRYVLWQSLFRGGWTAKEDVSYSGHDLIILKFIHCWIAVSSYSAAAEELNTLLDGRLI